ncbi:hypothetical protein GMOD_00006072 [Pyrenophora seminiperda CCB06]|uniref:Uncharacterized protein n=1 Tax=Pyrenophora seminiperda CCB06 TaxID=1302712 RepID=A0A3M7M4B8_9PLEO|nr:hypothetical protein GMOD_00006072 [Pyrenophora seminiperda CCB06]
MVYSGTRSYSTYI